MSKGVKKLATTDKSILIQEVTTYREKGKKISEIAVILGFSEAYIKKICAVANIKKPPSEVHKAINILKNNPHIPVEDLNLTDSQKDMLYRSPEWRTEIKPWRVICQLKNDPCRNHEDILRKLNEATLEALEIRDDWYDALTARQQFETFKHSLKEMRKKFSEIRETTELYVSYVEGGQYVNMEKLKMLRDSIPMEEAYPLPKSSTGRLLVPETVAIMHDFRYLQIVNDIRILENKITRQCIGVIREYTDGFNDQAKRLIRIYMGCPIPETLTEQKDDRCWTDAGEFISRINEKAADVEITTNEVKTQGKRLSRAGSNRAAQEMVCAVHHYMK